MFSCSVGPQLLKHFLVIYLGRFNSLPNNKILDQSNLKDFADDKINVTYVTNFVLGREENIVGKAENAGYQHFLLSHNDFNRPSCQGC